MTLRKNYIIYIIGFTLLAVCVILIYNVIPSSFSINEEKLSFDGAYGMEIQSNKIKKLELLNSQLKIKSKKHGFDGGEYRKGHFYVQGYGSSDLILESIKPPYILIEHGNQQLLFVNYSDTMKTISIYHQIAKMQGNSIRGK